MINLSELKHLKFISESQPVYCHQQAEKQLDAALTLMASQETAPHPGRLLQACSLLMDALRYHRLDIRPRIALAYAFSLLDEEDMAIACLSQALELDAQNPLILAMLQGLGRVEAPDPFRPWPAPLSSQAQADLYDRIDQHILSRLQRLSRYPHYQLEAAASGERARLLLSAVLEVRAICQEIRLRLLPLDRHPQLPALRRRMQPLESQLRQLEQKYCLCGEYRLLQKEMEISLNACTRLEGDFSRRIAAGTLLPELDALLNHCDRFADRLDALYQAERQAPELILLYECLLDRVADLRERQQRFHNSQDRVLTA